MAEGAGPTGGVVNGTVIGARYRVERVLAKSTMSQVVSARDQQLEELVAIKILLPQRVANAEARARFGREARAASKIKGEGVARVTDVGALDDGSPYMVMEHLDGESLATALERRQRVPPPEAILYALQICDVLREAHRLGITHRGLRPANLFLAKRHGRPPGLKVLDFGITNIEEQDRDGSPSKHLSRAHWYMAPEQLKSAMTVDARSDIWAVGVILFEMIIGEAPFEGATIPEVVAKVLNDMPNLRGAPQPLQPIFRRCLAKAPGQRYPNVDELAAALRALDGVALEVEARRMTPPPSRTAPAPVTARSPEAPPPAPAQARISAPPDTIQDDALMVGDDEAELIDETTIEDDEEGDGDVVDEAELLPSLPPPTVEPLPELPKAPPRTIVWLDQPAPVAAKPLEAKEAPKEAPKKTAEKAAEKVAAKKTDSSAENDERTRTTDKPPPPRTTPNLARPPAAQPEAAEGRRRWLLLAVVALSIPAAVFAVGRLVRRARDVRPEPSHAASAPISTAPPTASLAANPDAPPPVASASPAPLVSVAVATVPPAERAPEATGPAPRDPGHSIPPVAAEPTIAMGPKGVAPNLQAAPPTSARATARPAQPPTPPPAPVAAPATKPAAPAKPEDDATVALQVAMRNHSRLRAACWDTSGKTTQIVSVVASVDAGGAVTSANATSADPGLASCVAGQVRSWSFPPGAAGRSMQIPVRFRR